MDPFTLAILGAVAVAIGIPLLVVTTLRFLSHIRQWFRDRINLMFSGRVAIGLKERLRNGQYSYVQGVFDVNTEKLIAAQKYQANKLDQELMQAHGREDLVVFG
jgi:hypothetical protein